MQKVLMVSGSSKGIDYFSQLLREQAPFEVSTACDGTRAAEALEAEEYSLVVVITPLADCFGIQAALKAAQTNAGVILVASAQLSPHTALRLGEEGVFVFYLEMGRRMFGSAVSLMLALHRRLIREIPKSQKLQQKIQDIRQVDRAKCLLIQYWGLTEEDAHRYIEKKAMDRRVPRVQVAKEILDSFAV